MDLLACLGKELGIEDVVLGFARKGDVSPPETGREATGIARVLGKKLTLDCWKHARGP